MKRLLVIWTLAALAGGACIDETTPGYTGYGPVDCSRYTSCGSCTPVLGCGWCSMGTKGACVDQPNACAAVPNFYWTWEQAGCPAEGDAGATATDGSGHADGGALDGGALDGPSGALDGPSG